MLKLLRILLIPFSYLFYLIVSVRNFLFDSKILKGKDVSAKVISVGNITLGGTGKTPTVIYLAGLLKKLGYSPAILSRGYGRKSKGYKLVFDGTQFFCDADTCGDEIILEAQNCQAPAAVSENRVEGANKLIQSTDIDSIVLDDAFQHRWINRDVDVILIDQDFLLRSKYLDRLTLPSGFLRESFSSVKRADVVLINRKFNDKAQLPEKFNNILNGKNVFFARYEVDGFYDVKDYKYYPVDEFLGQKSLVVSGIAKHDSFLNTLKSLNIDITNNLIFRDHKNYAEKDIQEIRKQFYETNAYSVLTTEKDAVKLYHFSKELDDIDIYFIRIKLVLDNENEFEEFLQSIIK
jgi:tetraacyldisaccharide 4'-kinase